MESRLKQFIPRFPLATCLNVLCAFSLCGAGETERLGAEDAGRVTPNRTLPRVSPPQSGLAFPPDPTPHDFFRARVFEEPLVPIGGEPSADENAALAAALLGYAKRSGLDDFSSLTGFL